MRMTIPALLSLGAFPLRRGLLLLILIVAPVALLGCQPSIEVVQPASPVPAPTAALDERNLAIMGVDFDPPLEAGQILTGSGITLLVALENQGRQTEPAALVTAHLYDPDSVARADLAGETITVRSLAPGELRVVRFTQVNDLPVRTHYKLAVEVAPLPGERQVDDNVRTYDIIVHAAE
jgi:hypothetical protein